jgi:hypothetical protein
MAMLLLPSIMVAADQVNETQLHYNATMQALVVHVFPKNVLATQRQWFWHYMKKPAKYSMREYVAHINKINSMMVEFPPNFNTTQKISKDEMKDLLEFSIPWHWRMEMVKQTFWPLEHDVTEVIEFCECQETCESLIKTYKALLVAQASSTKSDGPSHPKKARVPGRTNKHKRKGLMVSYNDSGGQSGCQLHPNAINHTTAQCMPLITLPLNAELSIVRLTI